MVNFYISTSFDHDSLLIYGFHNRSMSELMVAPNYRVDDERPALIISVGYMSWLLGFGSQI
jgi:hypothetical protein